MLFPLTLNIEIHSSKGAAKLAKRRNYGRETDYSAKRKKFTKPTGGKKDNRQMVR
uniref:Uncharacterized protein n=1 Tax=Amphimedon queenslandica TaxID=400682 RepID=A0A1X7SDP9_AMPQE